MTDEDVEVMGAGEEDPEFGARQTQRADTHTVKSRDKLREQMKADIARFLESGGQIQQVPVSATAEQILIASE